MTYVNIKSSAGRTVRSLAVFLPLTFFLGVAAYAQDKPSWVAPLPYGEIFCETSAATGFEWHEASNAHRLVRFPLKIYTLQKMDPSHPKIAAHNCKLEDKPEIYSSSLRSGEYTEPACYRFNTQTNMLGWTQGWCTEVYSRGHQPRITCESEKVHPKAGFRPGSYFYSYGSTFGVLPDVPEITAAFTETGSCGAFRRGYTKRFKSIHIEAFYPPTR